MTPTKYTKERDENANCYARHVVSNATDAAYSNGADFARTYTLKEMEPILEKLRYIEKNARGAIVLSTQEGTKAEAFDFVVSTLELKAREALELWDRTISPQNREVE